MSPKDRSQPDLTENTPLELYDTAYRLQYVDNRISEALKYYELLIKEFPDSNECGYAAVQIQKIKASDLALELNSSKKSLHPLAVVSFVFSLILFLLLGAFGYYFYKTQQANQNRTNLYIKAISKLTLNEYDEALKILAELKIIDKTDITPFEISARIYRKKQLFEQAKAEYDVFFRLNPDRKPTDAEKEIMLEADNTSGKYENRVPATPAIQPRPQEPPPPPSSIQAQTPKKRVTSDVPSQKRSSSVPEQKNPKIKSLFLVDPDSISYY
ncbi:MAG: tetratricopeptide repeat protein [Fibrobacter sp.]|nr:tetratricopeptide repeat protein [Fibrobacter sp.]